MNRIGGHAVVEIDADVRKFAEDRRGKAELRPREIAGALDGPRPLSRRAALLRDSTEMSG